MDLRAEHHFPADVAEVVAAMVDPAYVAGLHALPDVGQVEVVDGSTEGVRPWIAMRMVYDGSLDPIAARVLGSSSPSWIQTYRLDVEAGRGTLDISPENHGSILRCRADLGFDPSDGGTRRRLVGELSVKVPLLGGRAERALGPAIVARIDVEAQLLSGWLSRSD